VVGTWNGWWGGETDGGGVERIVGGWNRSWGGGGTCRCHVHCHVLVSGRRGQSLCSCWWFWASVRPSCRSFITAVVSANSMAGRCGTSGWTVDVPRRCQGGRLWGGWGGGWSGLFASVGRSSVR
jgi:hypothetical protein